MNPLLSQLKQIRSLLEDPNNWIQGLSAVDKNGIELDANHPDACKFCLYGAALSVAEWDTVEGAVLFNSLERACGVYPNFGLGSWNDAPNRTHQDVIKVIDTAIAVAINNEAKKS